MQNAPESTLTQWVHHRIIPQLYPHLFTDKSWQWAVKQRHYNGLHPAFRKVGKKLFVNTKVLAECLDQQTTDIG